MANKKISELPYIGVPKISGNTLVPLVTYFSAATGDTVHTYVSDLQTYLISGLTGNTDVFVTGGTYSNGNTIFTNNTGGTFNVMGFYTGATDVFVTGGTYSAGTITITNNTGGTFNITGVTFSGSSSVVGDYLPLSGGTVTGSTQFTQGLSSNTISATTYQNLPISGLTEGSNINISGSNGNYTISVTGITGGSTFTGGTVSGSTIFTNGLTANTISATTYYNLPTDVFVTGGTYSAGTSHFTNNTGGTFNVTGFTTGNTLQQVLVNGNTSGGNDIIMSENDDIIFKYAGYNNNINTNALTSNRVILFPDNSGTVALLSDILTFTGGTVSGGTNFTNGLTANTISATTYYNLPIDIRVTGSTYNNNTFTYTNNTGGTFSTLFNTVTGLTVNGDLNVTGNTVINSGLTASTVYTNYIDFNTGATVTTQFGRINWDSSTGTLNIGVGDSSTGLVDFQVGQEEVVRVFNSELTTLQKGEVVYVSGSQGNRPAVKRASAVSDGYSVTTLGMVDVAIPSGGEGYVTTFGIISNLNTLGLTGGTPVWLSPTVAGAYTSTKPQAPQHTVLLGYVIRVNATVGSIFVNISNGWEIDELHDVRISAATEGDLLLRSSYSGTPVWVNSKTLPGSYTITGNTNIGGGLTANTISAATYQNLPDNVTGNYLPLSGGTVSGNTIFTSGLTANTLNVTGLTQTSGITSTGGIIFPHKTITTNYTTTTSDYFINITGGTFDVTLQSAVGVEGKLLVVKNEGDGIINVLSVSGQTIDDRTDVLLTKGNSLQIISDNKNWVILGYNISSTQSNTGVISFTGLSKVSSSTFYVSPVKGYIVDDTTNPVIPFLTYVDYSGGTFTDTYVNTDFETYVYLTSGNTIGQQPTPLTQQQRRQNIFLGKIGHPEKISINLVFSQPDFTLSPLSQLRDVFTPINLINGGVYPSPNGVNLKFNTSAGFIYGLGINFTNSPLSPNALSISGTSPCTFQYRTQTGGTVTNVTDIDPLNYDVSGTKTPIVGTKATNQRIYLLQNGTFRIQYGQTTYNTISLAIESLQTESFTPFPNFVNNAVLLGILTVLSTATDLTDTTKARLFFASKFGETVGAAGGVSTTNLQQAYNNSSEPEILINSTLDGLSIKNGTGNLDNVTNLLEGVNTAGSITSFIRADGLISGSTIATPSFTANTNGLTATTISATTYQNLPTDIRVTGSTYNNNTFTYTNNTGGTFNVLFNTVTGLTVNGNLTVTGNTLLQSISGSSLDISGKTKTINLQVTSGASAGYVLTSIDSSGNTQWLPIGSSGSQLDPVISITGTTPGTNVVGDRYLISGGTGIWSGRTNQIAEYTGASSPNWIYTIPVVDNVVFVTNTLVTYRYDGTNWIAWQGSAILQNGNSLGTAINIGSNNNQNLTFRTSGQTRVTISASTGNVGIGTTTPRQRLDVSGNTIISSGLTAQTAVFSSSSQNVLTVIGSGNSTTSPIFTVQGSSGELFSVNDSLVGSLFSVNDISGLPIVEVFSDNTTIWGSYQAPSLNTTTKVSLTAGTNTIYSIPTSAYTGAFYEYTLISTGTTGARAGQIMSIWSGTSANFTETSTLDIGTTTGVTFTVAVSGSNAVLSSSATTAGWTVKTIIRSI